MQRAAKRVQGDPEMRVRMPVSAHAILHVYSNAKLLTDLALQTICQIFPRLKLATGKFPQPA